VAQSVYAKLDDHEAAVALNFMHYNFARIHQTLRVTPAKEASVSDHAWEIEEVVGLLDLAAAQPARSGNSNWPTTRPTGSCPTGSLTCKRAIANVPTGRVQIHDGDTLSAP